MYQYDSSLNYINQSVAECIAKKVADYLNISQYGLECMQGLVQQNGHDCVIMMLMAIK